MIKNKRLLFFLLIACITVSVFSQTRIPSNDPNLVYVGRVSHKTPGCVKFSYPGVSIHTLFTGTSVKMLTSPNSGYYMIELDDKAPYKVASLENDSIILIADSLGNALHRLTITTCNEGISLKPAFYGLILDNGASLLGKPQLPSRKMEFIGNSITCALGIEDFSEGKNKAIPATQNAYYSFAHQTARRLQAQCVLVSRSGIGIYRNTNGKKLGDRKNMQVCYNNTMYSFDENAERWDFSKYIPDVVCINLGTNDTTNPAYDIGLLTNAFVNFIHTIRRNYPNAKIVLLSGTMRRGTRLADLKKSLDDAVSILKKEGENKVYRFDFTPADGSLGYGSFMHPSLKQHTQMAEELVPFIQKITGWE